MQCESCQQREATIAFTTVTGDQKQTLHLCPPCARRESEQLEGAAPETAAPAAPAPAEPKPVKPAHVAQVKKVNVVIGHLGSDSKAKACSECGLTYDEFRKVGRLGCVACYAAFGEPLRRLLKRIHGAVAHVGRGPRARDQGGAGEEESLEHLQQELRRAVQQEAYERAAELRDRIARRQTTP